MCNACIVCVLRFIWQTRLTRDLQWKVTHQNDRDRAHMTAMLRTLKAFDRATFEQVCSGRGTLLRISVIVPQIPRQCKGPPQKRRALRSCCKGVHSGPNNGQIGRNFKKLYLDFLPLDPRAAAAARGAARGPVRANHRQEHSESSFFPPILRASQGRSIVACNNSEMQIQQFQSPDKSHREYQRFYSLLGLAIDNYHTFSASPEVRGGCAFGCRVFLC